MFVFVKLINEEKEIRVKSNKDRMTYEPDMHAFVHFPLVVFEFFLNDFNILYGKKFVACNLYVLCSMSFLIYVAHSYKFRFIFEQFFG